MGLKIEAVYRFVAATGKVAAIGRLADAGTLLSGQAGTTVVPLCHTMGTTGYLWA